MKRSLDLSNVELLPVWKNGTAADRFRELALMAEKNPERFQKLMVVYTEETGRNSDIIRYATHGIKTMELLGLLRLAEIEVLAVTR